MKEGLLHTEIINIAEDESSLASAALRACEALRRGEVISFPTETVYALACLDEPSAKDSLALLKGREASKPFSFLVATREEARALFGDPSPTALRLLERCTPGPLTIVFARKGGPAVGVRIPSHRFARTVLGAFGRPILATSANPSGEPEAVQASEVKAYFDGKIALIVDGGRTEFGRASTVVRVENDEWSVEREGVISRSQLERCLNTIILFVCAGNTCRSPLAEEFCRKLLARRMRVPVSEVESHGYTVLSAGISAKLGARASDLAIWAARAKGVDLGLHLSQPLTDEMAQRADFVFVVELGQLETVRARIVKNKGKVLLLDPAGGDIRDPAGGDYAEYLDCARRIEQAIEKVVKEL